MAFHAALILRFLKCSGKNVLYSSCHLPNHELVSFQYLHHTKLSWNITPLGSFRSSVIYFAQKEQKKVEIVRILSDQVKIHQIRFIFETTNNFFFEFYINPQCHDSWILYTFLAKVLYTFSKRRLSWYKSGEISCEQPKIWNFAFC